RCPRDAAGGAGTAGAAQRGRRTAALGARRPRAPRPPWRRRKLTGRERMAPPDGNIVASLAALPEEERRHFIDNASADELAELYYVWRRWARPSQLPPSGDWRLWLLLAGRGFCKTRAGGEYAGARVKAGAHRIALVGPTAEDTRDIMVEGESGILTVSPPDEAPRYVPSKRRVVWPNGAIAALYSADEPRRLRGPEHDTAWCDELAAWRYPEAWDMLMFGLRVGIDPRCVVTTTPRPIRLLRELLADPKVAVTRGTTYDNRRYLARSFFSQIVRQYEGTRLGRQELQAETLEDLPGALWNRGVIEACRASQPPRELVRVVVAIDPAGRATETAIETGIVVAGKSPFTYVVLRYRHDPLAAEFANVGVVLHQPASGFLNAK